MRTTLTLTFVLVAATLACPSAAQNTDNVAKPNKRAAKLVANAQIAALDLKIKAVFAALPEDLRESIKYGEAIDMDWLDDSELALLKKFKGLKKMRKQRAAADKIGKKLKAFKKSLPANLRERFVASASGDVAAFAGMSETEKDYMAKFKKLKSAYDRALQSKASKQAKQAKQAKQVKS